VSHVTRGQPNRCGGGGWRGGDSGCLLIEGDRQLSEWRGTSRLLLPGSAMAYGSLSGKAEIVEDARLEDASGAGSGDDRFQLA